MGMRISGAVVKKEIAHNKDALEKAFDISLSESRTEKWNDYEAGFDEPGELLVYQKGGSTIIYFPLDWFYEKEDKVQKLLANSNEGVLFAMDETSMTFYFEFFEKDRNPTSDTYLFQDQLRIKGQNRLKLSAENDIIWDGLFVLLNEYTGGTSSTDEVLIYSFSEPRNGTKKSMVSDSENNRLNEFGEVMRRVDQIITERPVENGYKALHRLRKTLKDFRMEGDKYFQQIAEEHENYRIENETEFRNQIILQAEFWKEDKLPPGKSKQQLFHLGFQLSSSKLNLKKLMFEVEKLRKELLPVAQKLTNQGKSKADIKKVLEEKGLDPYSTGKLINSTTKQNSTREKTDEKNRKNEKRSNLDTMIFGGIVFLVLFFILPSSIPKYAHDLRILLVVIGLLAFGLKALSSRSKFKKRD